MILTFDINFKSLTIIRPRTVVHVVKSPFIPVLRHHKYCHIIPLCQTVWLDRVVWPWQSLVTLTELYLPIKMELFTDYCCLLSTKVVITHRAPGVIVKDLQTTLIRIVSPSQPDLHVSIAYRESSKKLHIQTYNVLYINILESSQILMKNAY